MFFHLGANYVQVKRRNTSGGHKSLAELRQSWVWRPDGKERITLCWAEDETALDS